MKACKDCVNYEPGGRRLMPGDWYENLPARCKVEVEDPVEGGTGKPTCEWMRASAYPAHCGYAGHLFALFHVPKSATDSD